MSTYSSEIAGAQADVAAAGAAVAFVRGATTASSSALRVRSEPKRFKNPSLVVSNPITLFIAASALASFVPANEDWMTFASATYAVVDVLPLAPDGVPIAYYVTGEK